MVILQIEMEDKNAQPKFKRMYIRYNAQKVGFLGGCRPIIGLDGCHLKGRFGGQILYAVARDANDNIFPVAFVKRTKIHGYGFCNIFQMTLGIQSNLIWSSSLIDKRYDFSSVLTYLTHIFKVQ